MSNIIFSDGTDKRYIRHRAKFGCAGCIFKDYAHTCNTVRMINTKTGEYKTYYDWCESENHKQTYLFKQL